MDKRLIANELLPVYETSAGGKEVDGRQLHAFLLIGRDFTTWIKDKIQKFGFKEGTDFTVTLTKTGERQNVLQHDYDLTLGMAKELCMVENNEQGSKARKYFIDIEERFKAEAIDVSKLPLEMQLFKQIWDGLARTQIEQIETMRIAQTANERSEQVESTLAAMKETFLQRDEDWRKWVNDALKGTAERLGGGQERHHELRSRSYQLLTDRAGCKLDVRLRNLRKRLEDSGATKTRIKDANKLDCIEEEPRLKEIYTSVVKELSIGSL
ncbi:MAG: putative Phage-related protein [Bacilli bacterium]|nr:putative Phage-related protein [Bacilli bacterium]